MKLKLISAVLFATVSSSSAFVTITFQGGELRDSLGNGVVDGSYVAIFADNDGDMMLPSASSFIGQTLDEGSFYEGNELISLFQTTSTLTGSAGGFNNEESNIALDSGLSEGTKLSIYWFPNYINASVALAAGQQYGTFETTTVGFSSGGDTALVVPPDATNRSIAYFDETIVGSSSVAKTADFTADQIVAIPEPTSTALLGLGALGFTLRRRR